MLTMLCAILMDILCCVDQVCYLTSFEQPQSSYVDLDNPNTDGFLILMEYANLHLNCTNLKYAQIAPS